MATERIQISVSQTGAVSVRRDIEGIGSGAKSSASSVDTLKAALASYIGLQAAQKVSELADAGTRLTNVLKQAGLSGQSLTDEQNKLFDLATANGQSVNQLAGIFQKLSAVQGQLGISGADVDKALVGISASMKLSSGSAEDQSRALLQLSQVFGGLKVQSQDYNSLIDGAYPLLQAVANGSDRFKGSVSALSAAVRESSVTTKEFFDALLKGSDANIALAASFNLTVGQALTNLNTKLIQLVLYINTTTGAFTGVALTINFFAQNLGIILGLLSPIIAGFTVLAVQVIGGYMVTAVTAATTAVGGLITTLSRLLLVLLANPAIAVFVAITAAVATIITLTGGWADALQTVIDAINTAIIGAKNLLTIFGATFADGQFEIKVTGADLVAKFKDGSAQLSAAIPKGAAQAAPTLKNAVASGGQDAAQAIEAANTAAVARFNYLNGVAQKTLTNTAVDGGNLIFNRATGAVEKAAGSVQSAMQTGGDSAGASVKQALTTGGQSAAQSLTIAGQTVSGGIADALQSRALQIAAQILNMFRAQTSQVVAEAAKSRADARATLAGIDSHRSGSTGSGGSGSASGGGGGGGGADYTYMGPGSGAWLAAMYNGGKVNGVQYAQTSNDNGGVTIINKTDPNSGLDAISSQQGGKTVVNVIKQNSSEIKSILGIV